MRKYDVAYVPTGPVNYYPAKPLQEMTLDEIKKKYIKMCAKANGDVSVCSRCKTPCTEGKRAIQLVATEVYDVPIPLYGGKTLIERAKEENAKWRAEQEAKKAEEQKKEEEKKEEKAKKRAYRKSDTWWADSLASGDQVQWLIDNMSLSKTQAKKKIYMYRYTHNIEMPKKEVKGPIVCAAKDMVIEKEEEKLVEKKPTKNQNDVVFKTMEQKIDDLMKLQTEYKQKAEEYNKLYKEVTEKIDVLCKAMDVFDA